MSNKDLNKGEDKKDSVKVFANDLDSIPEIKNTFVNGSRPLPDGS